MLDEWNAIYINSNDEIIKLTWNELYILEYLIDHKHRISTRTELIEAVYGKSNSYKKRQGFNSFIKRLREKLAGELEIINLPGVGYRIKYVGGEDE